MPHTDKSPTRPSKSPFNTFRHAGRTASPWLLTLACLVLLLSAGGPLGGAAHARGSLWAMGSGSSGRLGTGDTAQRTEPTRITFSNA